MSQEKNFNLKNHFLEDAFCMVRYATNSGKSIPASVIRILEQLRADGMGDVIGTELNDKHGLEDLIHVHDQLVKIVAPATPESIKYLESEENKKSFFGFFSKVSFIRQLGFATIFCFILLLSLATIKEVGFNSVGISGGLTGWAMFAHLIFLLSAAGLGASLHELWEARQYTTDRTFHPKFISSYWARFTLGLVAGLVLATLIPVEHKGDVLNSLKPATVALLGGFSTSLVYKVLNRLVELAEQFFGGKPKEAAKAENAAGKAKAELEKSNAKITRYITEVKELLSGGADSEQIKDKLEKMLNSILPASDDSPAPKNEVIEESKGITTLEVDEFDENEEQYRSEEYQLNVNEPIEKYKGQ
ncbi:MAG: hypothetical protein AAF502_20655 [Bacteroidota bacterium]